MKHLFSQPYMWVLVVIILFGSFLRLYQFEPWLHFELDQSRDARVVDEGFNGSFLDLPLLGPKAGGTFLRLGPAFYYLQYASGLVFGADPAGIAFFVPLLSILALVFVYLLIRRGFSRFESLALTLLFSVSVYVVLYGRFAWNPNLLIFFLPAGFYALLRAVDKEEKYGGRWFVGSMVFLTLATQFHFLAFLAVPAIAGLFLLLKRPVYSWKTWVVAIGVVPFLYLPMILNETEAGYTNTQEFLGAITEKSSKETHTFIEKTIRDATEYSQAAIVILTGFEGATIPAVVWEPGQIGTTCDAKCDQGKWYGVTGFLLLGLSVMALFWTRFRARAPKEKDFYDLSIIWLLISFVLFLPLSYGVAPRFYLLVTPLFFILLGVLLKTVSQGLPENKRNLWFGFLVGLLVASNLYFLHGRFTELSLAKTEPVESRPDRILKEQIRVTLEQQRAVVAFFKERQQATGYPIYMFSDPQYRRALKYLMEREGIQNDVLGFSGIYTEGEYYLVFRQRGDYEPVLRKYRESYEVVEYKPFGTLMVIALTPKPEKVQGTRQDFSIVEKPAASQAPPRYTWREFFERQNASPAEDDDGEDEQDN